MALLTKLGLPTGFHSQAVHTLMQTNASHAGLERALKTHTSAIDSATRVICPGTGERKLIEIFKSPEFSENKWIDRWAAASNVVEVIVPVRQAGQAARSRAMQVTKGFTQLGGFTHGSKNASQQQAHDDAMLLNLIYRLAASGKRATLLAYPQHVRDANYSMAAMSSLLARYSVSESAFLHLHAELYKAPYVHSFE
mgnify:CR=1 FL=1